MESDDRSWHKLFEFDLKQKVFWYVHRGGVVHMDCHLVDVQLPTKRAASEEVIIGDSIVSRETESLAILSTMCIGRMFKYTGSQARE